MASKDRQRRYGMVRHVVELKFPFKLTASDVEVLRCWARARWPGYAVEFSCGPKSFPFWSQP
jgi:hypothetical protein